MPSIKHQSIGVFPMGVGDVTANISRPTGKALNFDGATDYILLDSGVPEVIDGGTFTISGWIKSNAIANNQAIFSQTNASNDRHGICITASKLKAGQYTTTWGALASTNNVLLVDTWYHFAYTYDRGEGTMFLDGVKQTGTDFPFANSNVRAAIGAASGLADYWFSGKIDDLRIYGRILTDAEISRLSKDQSGGGKLAGYWSFNDTSDLGHDDSGQGNDGTLTTPTSTGGQNTTEDDVIASRVNANSKYGFVPLASGREIMIIHIEEA